MNTLEQPSRRIRSGDVVSGGVNIDTSPSHFGSLRDSTDARQDPVELRRRMETEGYLFLPGLLDRDQVLAARAEVCRRLAASGQLAPGTDPMEAVVDASSPRGNFQPDLTRGNEPLHRLLYSGTMIAFFETLVGGRVRHFDFTWLRTVNPGRGTPSHVDSVYMNRGTPRLYTAWTPLGDIDLTLGGLMVLEGSNNHRRLRETYGAQDVDAYCENRPDAKRWSKSWGTGGHLAGDPNRIRQSIGGRWLTTEFRAGDLLTFSIYTVHASLDNRTRDRLRLSSDSRYQSADEPADERWISIDGAEPIGHGMAGKRGRIC